MKVRKISRNRKLLLNTIISIVNQIISFISGFIMPKMFLTFFGSNVNGLTSAISQFLGFFSLCELGVGAVVQVALYEPLCTRNDAKISQVIISSEKFFRKIAYLLLLYIFILLLFYPKIIANEFGYMYTAVLICVIAINSFAQYYFGITYKILLNADQLSFIQIGLNSICLILNIIISTIIMRSNGSIHLVKLSTALIFLLQPICLKIVVDKNYNINRKLKNKCEPLKQKWNGMAQHIATVILTSTDMLVLTLFSTLKNTSIYAVYFLVVNGLKQIIISFTSGMQSMLGNMYFGKEEKILRITFERFEWLSHTIVTCMFGCCGFLILPFITVYTRNITDANYYQPLFAILITVAYASYCIRTPYNVMTLAAGHFKQTQKSAIVEALINIVFSVIFVIKFGLLGVALGTLLAMVYRTIYLSRYVSKYLIPRKINCFIKHIIVDIITITISGIIVTKFKNLFILANISYISWLVLAVKIMFINIIISFGINLVFYKDIMRESLNFFKIRK